MHAALWARMFIETHMGWLKKVAGLCKTRLVGRWKTQQYAYASAGVFNLMRLEKILKTSPVTAA